MSGGFKFDFSASEDDNASYHESAHESGEINEGDVLITKLQQRCESSSCKIVNASAKSIPVNESVSSGDSNLDTVSSFQPKLGFHRHETVDLFPSTIDPIRYVIPQHTLSDDTTDLIPGVYEGGLKVWECSVDLCRFLASVMDRINTKEDVSIDGKSELNNDFTDGLEHVIKAVKNSITEGGLTMELGCGHGLPGCLVLRENIRNTLSDAALNESSMVVFTDFNDFVLQYATIPNAQINMSGLRCSNGVSMDEYGAAQSLLKKAIFAGGDWLGLSHKITNGIVKLPSNAHGRFDLILASETTYTTDSCNDTAFLMLKHLKIGTGVGLVATKRFYFGVGGGTDMFADAVKALNRCTNYPFSNKKLVWRTIKSYDTGNANIRDLIEVRCVTKQC